MWAFCWFLIYFLIFCSNVCLFLLLFCVFLSSSPYSSRISSFFQVKFYLFLLMFFSPFSLSSLLPLFHFSILPFKLFLTSSIFLLTYIHVFFFFFSLYFSLVYCTLLLCICLYFHYFPIYSLHLLRIFFFFVVTSPFSLFLTAVLPVSFLTSTKAATHDKSEYAFFAFKIYPHANETLVSDIFNCAVCFNLRILWSIMCRITTHPTSGNIITWRK